ncbi:MAG: DUF1194 domain-containing protein [Proteobacteria bacterium]|nr:DUF1194 domain-containing protein [Pseudomonadota bacterium]MDA1310953.1 DUF1194 domain-containing protein [Pseudomonadota bacterium]
MNVNKDGVETNDRGCDAIPMAWVFVHILIAVSLVWFAGSSPAKAQIPVDLELVLAVDSSASVDTREFELQVRGMAGAFRDPATIKAIRSGPHRAIAVTVVEWANTDFQVVDIPWMIIDGPVAAHRMAVLLETLPRAINTGATSISGALRFSAGLFPNNGFDGIRQVIDLSCDGRNNQGAEVHLVRDAVVGRGITINGLTILNEHPTLNYYFQQKIIGGVGAFVEIANDYAAYSDAFLRKLIKEVTNVPISALPHPGDPLRLAIR